MRATSAVVFDVDSLDRGRGLVELLNGLRGEGVPVALVGHREAIEDLGMAAEDCPVVTLEQDGVNRPGHRDPPDPAAYIEARERMGIGHEGAVLVAGSAAGVDRGRRGGFGLVVGVTADDSDSLTRSGADVVIGGTDDLPADIARWVGLLPMPGDALASVTEILSDLGDSPAVFLDYDGTLTPIVDDPSMATIGDPERDVLRRLARRVPVAIVSGRGLDDVRSLVSVGELFYAGSHGFEIEGPDGERFEHEAALQVLPDMDAAQNQLDDRMAALDGVVVERKRFAIAVHTRRAASQQIRERAGSVARDLADRFDRLVLTGGKEVHELRPAVSWDKGAALSYVLDVLPGDPRPLYIGDDQTDEDAFAMLRGSGEGVGILVGSVDSPAQTWARFVLASPDETIEFLTRLLGQLE